MKSYSILPIGSVNLIKGTNNKYGTVWNCWEEGKSTCYLFKTPSGKFRVVVSWGTGDPLPSMPNEVKLQHDHTSRTYGTHQKVGIYPYTKTGLLLLAGAIGSTSVQFATFK